MSSSATTPANATATTNGSAPAGDAVTSPNNKGKGKVVQDESMDEEEDDEEEDEEEEEEEGEEDDEMDDDEDGSAEKIDPSAILPRRTRGARVDYASAEALAKAGLKADDHEDENEDSFTMQEQD